MAICQQRLAWSVRSLFHDSVRLLLALMKRTESFVWSLQRLTKGDKKYGAEISNIRLIYPKVFRRIKHLIGLFV